MNSVHIEIDVSYGYLSMAAFENSMSEEWLCQTEIPVDDQWAGELSAMVHGMKTHGSSETLLLALRLLASKIGEKVRDGS